MTAESTVLNVTVGDGKYTIIQHTTGSMSFLRRGEPWPAANRDFAHVGLILVLAQEVRELREQLAAAKGSR